MAQLHDLRLRLLVQQESERIAATQPDDLDLSVVQARCLCWLALLLLSLVVGFVLRLADAVEFRN